ncbi:hypothetical protein [Jannaschia sp. M317]|uniref:hypothetical protein n=1 Tax=Jannaschia sp. M317 TaxID=2867011 RepID=UPI0021A6D2C0|nr:hypothetical protein [Jannaschia sp. M317]UWQ19664.1 hypothetical protein K3551_18095 [Jannaschia sp. M317]
MIRGLTVLGLIILVGFAVPLRAETPGDHVPMTIPPAATASGITVQVTEGRRSMRGLNSRLRAARRAMHQGADVSPEDLRDLADRGDGLAATRYTRILLADPAATASDRAYYAALAVQTGRGYLLDEMLTAMDRLDPEAEPRDRVRLYISTLYPQAWAGNAVALDAVYRFNGEGTLFGALSDATRDRLLAEMREIGDGRGQLGMALRLLEARAKADTDTAWSEADRVQTLLTEAAASPHPGVATAAATLLHQLTSDPTDDS